MREAEKLNRSPWKQSGEGNFSLTERQPLKSGSGFEFQPYSFTTKPQSLARLNRINAVRMRTQ